MPARQPAAEAAPTGDELARRAAEGHPRRRRAP